MTNADKWCTLYMIGVYDDVVLSFSESKAEEAGMARSMTAFGRCSDIVGGKSITVELKSVNNRFLDCNSRVPRAYGAVEERIKPYLQSRGVVRGKVDVFVSVIRIDGGETELALDGEYLRRYIELLRQMRDEYGLRDDISVMTVAANRDIFTETESGATEQDTEDIMSVISRAVDTFIAMRIAEGENICRDLCKKLEHLGALVGEIEREEPRMNEAYRARLEAKLRAVLEGRGAGAPDEARIITECAIFADKVAVDEETVRLRSHLDAFGTALSSDDAVGRRLDFLVQEIGREINTIGSKVSDVHMTDTVVEMKSELERIREQVQNLE